MSNPAPTLNQINAFNATQGTTIDFNIIGGTEVIRSNKIYIYDLSDNSLICTHLYVSTESIHELPPNTSSSIVYASGKSSADFTNNTQYYAQIQTFTDTNGTQGASGLSVAKLFWCLPTPTLTLSTIPTTISTTSYNVSATYTPNTSGGATNEIQEFQFNLYSGVGALLQTSGVVLYGEGVDLSYNFSGLDVGSTYYVTLNVTTTQGMSVSAQSNTFSVSIDTPTMGSASVVNNGCDGYISVTSNLSSEYEHEQSVDAGEIMSFTTDSANNITELDVDFSPIQDGTPWQSTTEEQEPYFFRAIPNVGHSVNSEYDTLVGGSVAWNQVFPSTLSRSDGSITMTNNNDGSYTFDGTASSSFGSSVNRNFHAIQGHKYLFLGATDHIHIRVYPISSLGSAFYPNTDVSYDTVFTCTNDGGVSLSQNNCIVQMVIPKNTVVSNEKTIPMFFDLTQMFGTTIADHIYTLESNNAGAGVAWFKKLFPKPYYAYNAGELMSVNAVSHDMVGFNAWDEEWELGDLNTSNGQNYPATNRIRSKNYIRVLPNTTYYFKSPYNSLVCFYDANKNFVNIGNATLTANATFTTQSNVHYMRISPSASYGTTYKNDICINLSWDGERDGEYEEYVKHSYALDSDLVLRGIPKLDASNNLYYDGDTYESDGTVTRKYGIVDLGTLDWTYQSNYTRFYTSDISSLIKKSSTNNEQINALCLKYTQSSSNGTASISNNNTFGIGTSGALLIRDESYSDETTFTSAMSGVYLIYELATSTTETADPFTNLQVVDPDGTEEYISNSVVPVGHKSRLADIYPISGWIGVDVSVCGINLWDEEWELGGIDEDGNNTPNNSRIRSKNYIPIAPNATYYFKNGTATMWLWAYDGSKTYIGRLNGGNSIGNATLTIPDGVKYIRFVCTNAYGTTYNNDISINYPSTDHDYHAYNGTTYTSTFPKYKQQVSQDKTPYITKNIGDTYADTLTENLVGGTIAWNQSVPDTTTTHTISGSIASMNDAVAGNFESVVCDIDPIQDLHGYDSPWVGGGHYNKWDEQTKLGYYDSSTGEFYYNNTQICSVNPIKVEPSTSYYVNAPSLLRVCYYEEDMTFISSENKQNATITTPANCKYIHINTFTSPAYPGGTTYQNDIAVNYPSSVTTYSPWENICPISGWSGVDATVDGKNLLDIDDIEVGTAWNGSSNSARARLCIPCKPSTQYTLSMNGTNGLDGVYITESPSIPATVAPVPVTFPKTITTGATSNYITLGFNKTSIAKADVEALKLQLELGTPATTYESYNGTTYTVSWSGDAGTVYGGTVDVVSGELTVLYGWVDLGSLSWRATTASGQAVFTSRDMSGMVNNASRSDDVMCDSYEAATTVIDGTIFTYGSQFIIRNDNYNDADIFATSLSGVYAVYPLATPTTYQLDPVQVACLLGQNNVWNNISNTTVAYPTNHSYQSLSTTHKYYKRINGVESISVGSDVVADVGTDNIIDLTQMFGSTIADYIYNREQSSSSNMGVKFFKSLFPNDDYDYNSGTLISVNASAHVIKDANGNVVHTYPLDSDLVLRGIPKLDANNKLYYDGDVYSSDGGVDRKFGIIDLGGQDISWSYESTYNRMSSNVINLAKTIDANSVSIVCAKYLAVTSNYGWQHRDSETTIAMDTTKYLRVYNSGYTDPTAFKTAMSGVYLVYELATPTTESADPFEENQAIVPNGIEEYIVTEQGDVEMPVGHDSTYYTTAIYGGTIDMASGVLTMTHKVVDLGTLTWGSDSNVPNRYRATPSPTMASPSTVAERQTGFICSQYPYSSNISLTNMTDKGVLRYGGEIFIKDTLYTDATTFKNAMKGVQLVYELATPIEIQLTPQQIQTLSGQNNIWSNTNGGMSLIYQLPITSLLVKRRDVADVSGKWLTLYSVPITQASDMDFTFIDFLNQYGKKYQYALVPVLEQDQSGVIVQIEGGYTVSDNVDSIFDGVYIADQTNVERVKAGAGYGNVDMNQGVGSITPIGSKYPIVITNSQNQYHNGSIRGTIVPNDFYSNGNLSRIDMVNKRDELEQFLTNKRAKIIKDWNGKMWLVMIMSNVACSFDDNYGMGMVSFSADWLEVGDPKNQQDLYNAGLINVGGV